MITLDKEQIKRLHSMQIEVTGGLDGIRDEAMLDSALASAFQTFGGVELFPSTIEKIARVAYGLVSNHPFIDGNKRIGTFVMLVLLELNELSAEFTDDDIIHVGLEMANANMDDKKLLDFILKHIN